MPKNDETVYCDGCHRPAPNRRELRHGPKLAPTVVGRFGRVCYRRSALKLRELGEIPHDANGRDV